MTTIIVCGGRDYTHFGRIDMVLTYVLRTRGRPLRIVHGGARGADTLADAWALANGCERIAYPADWKAHGRAAGPIRNALMLEREKPDLVVAFPGGKGTADMVSKARAAGIEVLTAEALLADWGV